VHAFLQGGGGAIKINKQGYLLTENFSTMH